MWLLSGSGVVRCTSRDEGSDEGAEERPTRPSDREAVRFGHLASPPQSLEAPACRTGVVVAARNDVRLDAHVWTAPWVQGVCC